MRSFLLELSGAHHLLRAHPLIELRLSQVTQLQRRLLQREALLVGVLCNVGSLVVSDVGVQSSHQHQGVVHQLVDPPGIRLQTSQAVPDERLASVSNQPDRVKNVSGNQRLEHIQLEVSTHTAYGDSHLVAHHLRTEHSKGFALGRIDLAGHDAGSRFVFGQDKLSQTTSRAASQESNIVGDFHQADCDRVQGAVEVDQSIFSGQGFELVGSSHKLIASFFTDLLCDSLSKANIGIKASTDCGSSLGEL